MVLRRTCEAHNDAAHNTEIRDRPAKQSNPDTQFCAAVSFFPFVLNDLKHTVKNGDI